MTVSGDDGAIVVVELGMGPIGNHYRPSAMTQDIAYLLGMEMDK